MKKNSFVFGAIVLAVSGLICKILGAIYKIPLTNILGSQGMGIYYLIFPIYAFLLSFTSSSFSTAISKRVSTYMAENKRLEAHLLFRAALVLLVVLGGVAAGLLIVLSRIISSLQGLENAFICYIIIAPSIMVVAAGSAFKGYFQGLQNMVPTAISQIVAQIIKLAIGFLLASVFVKRGVIFGTVGALLGVTLSETIGTLFFVVYYFIYKKAHANEFAFLKNLANKKPVVCQMKMIFKEAIPFTLSSIILPMSMVIDSFLIVNILKGQSFEKGFATSLLGLNSGVINTLVSLPSTFSVGICMTIVPYITFALSKKNYNEISSKTALAFKLSLFIAIPCTFVFALFAPQILTLLYSGTFTSIYEFNFATTLLILSAINVLYLSLLQLTTSLLQAINRSYVPVISLSIALIFKVICEVFLISNPYINIAGAVISNAVCYFISTAINIYYFKKQIKLKFSFYKMVVCPLISSLSMGIIIALLFWIFPKILSYKLAFIVACGFGIISYVILLFVLRAFTKEETMSFLKLKKFRKTQV